MNKLRTEEEVEVNGISYTVNFDIDVHDLYYSAGTYFDPPEIEYEYEVYNLRIEWQDDDGEWQDDTDPKTWELIEQELYNVINSNDITDYYDIGI